MKTINLFGEDLKIAFNLAVQLCYEKITDSAFDLVDLAKVEKRIALFYAVIITNNPDTAVTIEKISYELTFEDLKTLTKVVDEVISEWYNIPKSAKLDEPEAADAGKNA